MIIKSIRHSNHKFGVLVNYVIDGMDEKEENRWILFHNLQSGYEREKIIAEFETNAEFLKARKTIRKKVYKYHEVLSFSQESSQYLTNEKLQDIAKEYLKLRDPEHASKAICLTHYEKKHTHLHFIISSNHIGSDRSSDMRMDNQKYYHIRRELERFTLQKYPELVHSTVHLQPEEIKKLVPEKYHDQIREAKSKKDFGKQTKKQLVADKVRETMDNSNSLNDFCQKLEQVNIKPYYRKEKLTGVIMDGKKYRLKTLGIELLPERLNVLNRLNELEKIQNQKERDKGHER